MVDQQLILAKVPILRIKCGSAYEGIVIDLNVNNSVAIRNTHLMSYYSACKFESFDLQGMSIEFRNNDFSMTTPKKVLPKIPFFISFGYNLAIDP